MEILLFQYVSFPETKLSFSTCGAEIDFTYSKGISINFPLALDDVC